MSGIRLARFVCDNNILFCSRDTSVLSLSVIGLSFSFPFRDFVLYLRVIIPFVCIHGGIASYVFFLSERVESLTSL
jgi:hypothetical protein